MITKRPGEIIGKYSSVKEAGLIHLIYCSAAINPMKTEELNSLLRKARKHNSKNNITGILLYIEGSFLQVLEGDAFIVDELFADITNDKRHESITLIIREPVAERSFGEWTMGYADVSAEQLDQIIGISDFFSKKETFLNISPGRARKIISAFRDGYWRSTISGPSPVVPDRIISESRAVLTDTFYSFAFQPILHFPSRAIYSYEALLRGRQNQPAEFILENIPVEDRPQFHEQCRIDAVSMARRLGIKTKLNINFPPSSLKSSPTAIASILKSAEDNDMAPSDIILEILESEIIRDYKEFRENILDYRRSGMVFALDDFGAGYAGLNLLAEYQPDFVKLDMMLIRNIDRNGPRQAIIHGIIRTCIELGIDIIAEGVETVEEYIWLRNQGIEYFQGFLLARPALEKLQTDFFMPE